MKDFRGVTTKIIRSLWYRDEPLCVLCSERHGPICPTCTENYLHPELGRCRGCGKLIPMQNQQCLDCEAGRGPKQLDKVVAWGHYDSRLKEFIHSVKYNAHPNRIREIISPFAKWAINQLPVVDGIVAVPMHAARLAERGFNQAEVIASALHWELGLPILQGVERIETRPSQALLSRNERLHNLNGAFAVYNPEYYSGRSVWLVDDVTTTGATLEAVAKVLRSSGTQEIYGLCLAAGREKRLVPSSE